MHNDTKCTVPLVVQHSANVKISWGCFFQNVNIFSISHCWNWNLWVWTVGLIKHDIFQTPWKMFPILPSDISYKKRSESAALLSVTMTWLTTTVWILFSSGVGDITGGPAALLVSERWTRSLVSFPVVRLTSAQSSCYAQSSRVCLPALKRSTSSAFISEGRQRVSDPVPVF